MYSPREQNTHGQRDHQDVIAACPQEVQLDLVEDGMTEIKRRDDIEEIRTHEDDIGSFDGDGGAG